MQFSISQRFFFDAAHSLERQIESAPSRRIHGHTYHAEVSIRGTRDAASGMVHDLGLLRQRLQQVREQLDHHLLDDVPGLGKPTLENLCHYIAAQLKDVQPPVSQVRVWREAMGDACCLDLQSH